MGARAESLAQQFESKAAEMTAVINRLSDADWKKTTAAEKWPIGVTAHHVAGGHEGIAGIVKVRRTWASGTALPAGSVSVTWSAFSRPTCGGSGSIRNVILYPLETAGAATPP